MTSSDKKSNKSQSGASAAFAGNLAVLILMLAFVIPPVFLHVSGPPYESVSLFGLKTPSMCFTKTWFDFDCVTCGMTRCFSLITHGRFMEAFQMHAVGPLLYLAMVAEAIYRATLLIKGDRWMTARMQKLHILFWVVMIAAMIFYWAYKMLAA